MRKTAYAPMIYTALCIMFWMRAYPLLGVVGGGWALEFSSFLGPKWHLPIGGLATEFRSEKIPRNRLGMDSVIPRKKVLIPRVFRVPRKTHSETRNGTEFRGKLVFWNSQNNLTK
jgi:hypothetical protein